GPPPSPWRRARRCWRCRAPRSASACRPAAKRSCTARCARDFPVSTTPHSRAPRRAWRFRATVPPSRCPARSRRPVCPVSFDSSQRAAVCRGWRARMIVWLGARHSAATPRGTPMKMTAAVLYEQGLPRPYAQSRPLRIETVDLDGPGEGEILVKIEGAGLCHSDLSTIDNSRPRTLPTIPGHEGAGIVAEAGAGVRDLKAGDHVVFVFVPSCGECRNCRRGRPNVCTTWPQLRARGELMTGGRRLSRDGKFIAHYSGISC